MKKHFFPLRNGHCKTTEFQTNIELDNISIKQLTIEPCVPWDN